MTYRAAIVDVDGTVVRGDRLLPGADEGIAALRAAGLDLLFCSNNPTKSASAYVERLADHGIRVAEHEVLTAAAVARTYLAREHAADDLFVVGSPGLRRELAAAGLSLVDDPAAAEAVVASYDREFDYDTMTECLWALSDPAVPLVGTDPDRTIPVEEREVPGSGAIVHAVAGVADRDPDVMLGKPGAFAADLALERLGRAPEEVLVVGDRPDTDIALGERAGMTTALVCTGVTDRAAAADADPAPDFVLDSLADVGRLLDG